MHTTALTLSPPPSPSPSPTSHPSHSPDPRIPRLLEWLQQGGAILPYLHIHTRSDASRSVHTLTSLPPHTPILSIPSPRILRLSHALSSPIGRALLARGFPPTFSHSFLACHLHYHLHCVPSSPLPALPGPAPAPLRLLSPAPLLPPPTLHLLPPSLRHHAQAMMTELRDEYDLLISTLSPPSLLTSLTSLLLRSSSQTSPSCSSPQPPPFPSPTSPPPSPSLNTSVSASSPSLASSLFPWARAERRSSAWYRSLTC